MYNKCKWSVFNGDGCVLKHLHIWRKMLNILDLSCVRAVENKQRCLQQKLLFNFEVTLEYWGFFPEYQQNFCKW